MYLATIRFAFAATAAVAVSLSCTASVPDENNEPRLRVIESGAVYAGEGGQFSELRELDSLRLRTVLDLDLESPIRSLGPVTRDWFAASARGLVFVHLPVDPLVPPSFEELDRATGILADSALRPILVHADGDRNRVRMVVAAFRIRVQQWSPDRAIASGERADALWPAWERQLLAYSRSRNLHAP